MKPDPDAPTTNPPTLETGRLMLRALTADDLGAVHRIFDDRAVRRYLFDDEPVSLETARSLLEQSGRDFADGGIGLFGIHRRDAEELVGFCGFLVVEGVGEPELTYGLLPAWWGQGLATEAARTLTRHALEEAGFRRALVATEAANVASMRVIGRLGARPLGSILPDSPRVVYFEVGNLANTSREERTMNARTPVNEGDENGPAKPTVEGKGVRVVRPGSGSRAVPQGVLGLDAVSRETVGSGGIFMARYTVPPGAHSDLHSHTNCETAVYVLRGRAYAYAGVNLDEYVEAGPGDFAYIPANLPHVVGCPASSEPLEYIVARNAPEEIVVSLRPAAELPIGPDGRMRDEWRRR